MSDLYNKLIFFIIITFNHASAYSGAVHEKMNLNAAENSNVGSFLLNTLNIEKGIGSVLKLNQKKIDIKGLIAEGGKIEDYSARWMNHFHDPLEDWNNAGLGIFQSSIIWGTGAGFAKANICSWDSARRYFYTYLTGKDYFGNLLAKTQENKEYYFAVCLQSIGQVMHLLQDASVPLHTRNDAHPFEATYETYTKNHLKDVQTILEQGGIKPNALLISDPQPDVSYAGLPPITGLFDRNQYNGGAIPPMDAAIGLAEYSNANFPTQDTMWKYPHPVQSDLNFDPDNWLNPVAVDAEDGVKDNRIYFGKSAGEPVEHLVAAAYWYSKLSEDNYMLQYAYLLDEKCFNDYSAKLIPRAAGYSTELLDYFFRGRIEISLPRDGFYALTSEPDYGFNQIKLRVKNTTPNNEEMNNGTIDLVVKYRLSQGDPFTNNISNTAREFSYVTVAEANGITGIPRDDFVELTFDLSHAPIPLWATDVYLQVVYKGQLGKEQDAVAVGFKDISEPSPIDMFNNCDKICLFGSWVNTDYEAVTLIDNPVNGGNGNGVADESDVYSHTLRDTYYLFWPDWWVGGVTNPDPAQGRYHYYVSMIYPGQVHRGIYVLTNYSYIYTYITYLYPTDYNDEYGHGPKANLCIRNAIKNQIEWSQYFNGYIRYVPNFKLFRGFETFTSNVIYPLAYPGPDHPCSFWDIKDSVWVN